jgi:hypothetical protein
MDNTLMGDGEFHDQILPVCWGFDTEGDDAAGRWLLPLFEAVIGGVRSDKLARLFMPPARGKSSATGFSQHLFCTKTQSGQMEERFDGLHLRFSDN